jgi:hypothetical protein
MDSFVTRLEEYAQSLEDGRLEGCMTWRSNGKRATQLSIYGTVSYESIPTMKECYELFGTSDLSIMARPTMQDGKWSICLVSIR